MRQQSDWQLCDLLQPMMSSAAEGMDQLRLLSAAHLRQHTIDRGQANEPTHCSHEAKESQVPGVGGWLAQVEARLLGHEGGDTVVKVEEHSDE